MNSVNLAGDLFTNTLIGALIEIPGGKKRQSRSKKETQKGIAIHWIDSFSGDYLTPLNVAEMPQSISANTANT